MVARTCSAPADYGRGASVPLPTYLRYRSADRLFYAHYARDKLDYTHHTNYTRERQLVQNEIIQGFAWETYASQTEPWLIFVAGPIGAGKSHVAAGLPIDAVRIDTDALKFLLPIEEVEEGEEGDEFGDTDIVTKSSLVHKESGYLAELILHEALRRGLHVIFEGTLKSPWYTAHIASLKRDYPAYRLALIAVTAPLEVIKKRVMERGQRTGREVPLAVVEEAFSKVPGAHKPLIPLMDFTVKYMNVDGAPCFKLLF